MFRYVCTPQQLYSEELGNYGSFGLSAQKQVQGEWVQCSFVPDVSVRQQLVEQLAQLCTCLLYTSCLCRLQLFCGGPLRQL